MSKPALALALAACCASPPSPGAAAPRAADARLMGFGDGSAGQRDLERRFDEQLSTRTLRDWMKRLSARPHHVGSPHGRSNAEWMAALFESWGYETEIEEFSVLFPTPKRRSLVMLEPVRFEAELVEPPLAEDSTSGQTAEQLPTYNAYSIDGDVTGELVYVNQGIPEDYEQLERRGISVAGRIVIARYGGSWRGIKPKVAAEHGALGCILYSDPRDDGYFAGDVYPEGGYRPERGAQRGSVADMPLYPGDPLTPGVGATADAERLPLHEVKTLTTIPVLPISYADAEPLLRAIGGPVAPAAWRGALPLTYHLGPGPARVRLQLEFDWGRVPAYDVIARLPGTERPDEWIIRGNHHDAWVNGATDPVSGMVVVLEEARAVAELVKQGWRPRRTIVYAAWDAEEPGLLGSTEWVERHAAELTEKAVAYINSDSNSRGFLNMGGSHSLQRFVNEVAAAVPDPQRGISVAERRRSLLATSGSDEERRDVLESADLALAPLGSGSDYTPFLQHLGIASLNVGFGGEGEYGQYHSVYDSFDHYVRFMDPEFEYGVALARVCGRAVLRLAEAELLPFEFTALASTVQGYVEEVGGLADRMREETAVANRLLEKGYQQAAADPASTFVAPAPKPAVPHLNFAPLRNAAEALTRSAARFDAALAGRLGSGTPLGRERRDEVNGILLRSERALTHAGGLPGRPWFVHHVYAPGFYTGYGVKTLPAVREAIEQRQWGEVEEQVALTARVLATLAARVDEASGLLAVGAP